MSLSPENYRQSIGIAYAGQCSCLVYLDRLVGEGPSGCDGWPLVARDGMVYSNFSYRENEIFPPAGYEPREGQSRVLARQVEEIRRAYWRGRHDSGTA